LEILRQDGIRVTFFWSGIWPRTYPALASSVVTAGHEIGNHSYDHPIRSKDAGANLKVRKEHPTSGRLPLP
jgi:peptidoglycan/xylan/chitin deacetylase (PgdA/CDA1 family)